MKNDEGMHHERLNGFEQPMLHSEIDESTFMTWKIELQKNLPMFWSSMNQKRKYF